MHTERSRAAQSGGGRVCAAECTEARKVGVGGVRVVAHIPNSRGRRRGRRGPTERPCVVQSGRRARAPECTDEPEVGGGGGSGCGVVGPHSNRRRRGGGEHHAGTLDASSLCGREGVVMRCRRDSGRTARVCEGVSALTNVRELLWTSFQMLGPNPTDIRRRGGEHHVRALDASSLWGAAGVVVRCRHGSGCTARGCEGVCVCVCVHARACASFCVQAYSAVYFSCGSAYSDRTPSARARVRAAWAQADPFMTVNLLEGAGINITRGAQQCMHTHPHTLAQYLGVWEGSTK